MLKNLRIRNFQAHRRLDIEFDPKVTTIVGPSDSGKSSIIRALRWAVFNRPTGTAFIRTGRKKCVVVLNLDDTAVHREKGKNNLYTMGSQEFKAFGNDVPDEVKRVFLLSEINFQGQHDAPFWLANTAGEVSRQLNQIVNLDIMDRTLSNFTSMLTKTRTEVKVWEEKYEGSKAKRKALKFVKEMDEDLCRLERIDTELCGIREQSENVLTAVVTMQGATTTIEGSRTALEAGLRAESVGRAWLDTQEEADQLADEMAEIKALEERLCQRKRSLSKALEQLREAREEIQVCPTCGKPL